MAYSTVPKTRRDGKITLKDNGAVTLDVAYEEGNLSFSVPVDDQVVIRDRNTISTVRRGPEQPITGTFSFYFREFTDAAVGGVRDFITGSNAYSANVSTGSTGSPYVEHFCVDIAFEIDGSTFSETDHTATMTRCVCVLDFSEGDPDVYSLSFTSYGPITYA